MSLDPRTRALLDRAKVGFEPSPHDALRVEAALVASLGAIGALGGGAGAGAAAGTGAGAGAGTGASAPSLATTAGAFAKLCLGIAALSAIAVGGATFLSRATPRSSASSPMTLTIASPPASALPSPESTQAPPSSAIEVPLVAPSPASSAPPPARIPPPPAARHIAVRPAHSAPSSLADELALVRTGTSRLHAGDASGALAAFDAHARTFPHGALEEERSAGRIHALCALGRTSEARDEAAALRAAHPASPHALRVGASCVSSP